MRVNFGLFWGRYADNLSSKEPEIPSSSFLNEPLPHQRPVLFFALAKTPKNLKIQIPPEAGPAPYGPSATALHVNLEYSLQQLSPAPRERDQPTGWKVGPHNFHHHPQ